MEQIVAYAKHIIKYCLPNRHCFVCKQASHELLCSYCFNEIEYKSLPFTDNLLNDSLIFANLATPNYHYLVSMGEYEGVLQALILKLKFGAKPLVAEVLARLFWASFQQRFTYLSILPQVLIPIPLSTKRLIEREYNQAALIAKHLSSVCDIPVQNALARVRHTQSQSSLDDVARQNNLHSAFSLVQPILVKSVAIVDDVVTTGATVNEVSRCLLERYPDLEIHVWSMALTIKKTAVSALESK